MRLKIDSVLRAFAIVVVVVVARADGALVRIVAPLSHFEWRAQIAHKVGVRLIGLARGARRVPLKLGRHQLDHAVNGKRRGFSVEQRERHAARNNIADRARALIAARIHNLG